jgi:hypothetical protein
LIICAHREFSPFQVSNVLLSASGHGEKPAGCTTIPRNTAYDAPGRETGRAHALGGACRHHPGPDSWWILLEFYGLIGSLPRKIAPLVLLENCGTHTDLVHSARCDKELEASGG